MPPKASEFLYPDAGSCTDAGHLDFTRPQQPLSLQRMSMGPKLKFEKPVVGILAKIPMQIQNRHGHIYIYMTAVFYS